MILIGCDFHTRFQQIATVNPQTGELIERRLEHGNGDVEKFYGTLPGPARVGVEATINASWFERMLGRYQHELWIGDAAKIRAARVRKQKTGCPAHPGFTSGQSLPWHLDSITGRARCPSVSAASA